ncbi:hypothetical protein AMAG_16735 [Allomyces macrogynus ATCC 38327]|uniref:Uncharacterized protein n=1 Tax=Allomyces macrogynus (strain ATCC 38327) TaxID=578462 RepID=A0A0L0TC07_ALLM3|nr:hypothetical protein AMAG_16735 [Allomyces macrogynus ATCC 38327]|eukprot:KNE72251.1 hypothetical protein AMAG_16735 [Allomyces macrogynus ATCC 38327]
MPSTVTDVEQSAMVAGKATADASTAHQEQRRTNRFLPASRPKRYLCVGTVLVAVGCLVTFMTLWFKAEPLMFSPTLKRLDYMWPRNHGPADWWTSRGTIVEAAHPWGIQLIVKNYNIFEIAVQDLDVSAEFAATKTSENTFFARAEHMPRFNVPSDGGWQFNLEASGALKWDVRDRAQARALAAILVLCNVPVTDLPPVLLNATSAADLPADPAARDAGALTWTFAARQVRGLLGLGMTPAPGTLTGDWPSPGSHVWFSPQILEGAGERVADMLCPETRSTSNVLDHIKHLVNVTNIAGREVAKSG